MYEFEVMKDFYHCGGAARGAVGFSEASGAKRMRAWVFCLFGSGLREVLFISTPHVPPYGLH